MKNYKYNICREHFGLFKYVKRGQRSRDICMCGILPTNLENKEVSIRAELKIDQASYDINVFQRKLRVHIF